MTWKSPCFTSTYRGMLFPAIVSLSFGILENLLFVTLSLQQFQKQYWLIILLRAFLDAPAHGGYGTMTGIFYGRAKYSAQQNDRTNQRRYLFLTVLVPTCIHGLYDWITSSQVISAKTSAAVLVCHTILTSNREGDSFPI